MNSKNRATLEAISARPTRADIRWSDIEILVLASGGVVLEREGSGVALILNGVRSVFHRPHPKPSAKKGAVDAMRVFMKTAGVTP